MSGKVKMVTMRDVAQASGFSPATVSIVLNNAPLARYIAPATKKRIEDAAKKLGYRPNAMARFLRSRRSQTVGVMIFDITDPFCTPVLRGIENALYQSSYVPIFADAHNQRTRFERYLEMLLEHHVEALIVVANWLFVDIQLLADLSKRNITAATIGWEVPGDSVSSVMVDNEAGGRLALEHLHLGSADDRNLAMSQMMEMLERQPSSRFVVHHHRAYRIPRHLPADRRRGDVSLAQVGQQLDVYEKPVGHHNQRFHVVLQQHFQIALEPGSLVVRIGKNWHVRRLIERVLDSA